MGLRYLIASLILFGVVRSFRPIVNKDTILLALFTWASAGLWGLGLQYVSTSESAVLSYTMPLISVPLSYVILSEKASAREWGGASVGLVGVAIYSITFANETVTTVGAVFTLLNAFFWALYTIYYRKLKNQDPTKTVASQLFFGAALFFLVAPLDYRLEMATQFWVDLGYLSVLSAALTFWLWNAMARLERVGKTTTLIYSIPVTVTLLQYVETSVLPSPTSLIGMCLMILGIYIARFEKPPMNVRYTNTDRTSSNTPARRCVWTHTKATDDARRKMETNSQKEMIGASRPVGNKPYHWWSDRLNNHDVFLG
jgi:drug/metabolite transporter (DMT)-like permease